MNNTTRGGVDGVTGNNAKANYESARQNSSPSQQSAMSVFGTPPMRFNYNIDNNKNKNTTYIPRSSSPLAPTAGSVSFSTPPPNRFNTAGLSTPPSRPPPYDSFGNRLTVVSVSTVGRPPMPTPRRASVFTSSPPQPTQSLARGNNQPGSAAPLMSARPAHDSRARPESLLTLADDPKRHFTSVIRNLLDQATALAI